MMLLFSDSMNEGVQQRETSYLRCRTQCQFASWLMTGGEPDLMANPDQRPRLCTRYNIAARFKTEF